MIVRLEFLDEAGTSWDDVRKIVGHKLFPGRLVPVNTLWQNDPEEGGWFSLKNGYFMDDPNTKDRLLYLGRMYALIDTFSAQALKLWAQYVWEWRWARHFDSAHQRAIVGYLHDYTAAAYERKTGLPGWWVYNDCSINNCKAVAWLEGK